MPIHPTAIVDTAAEIDPSVTIGPYAIIEGNVRIDAGTRVYPHAYISGWVTIGQNCEIHPHTVIGHLPQDFHYTGDRSYCRIGDRTVIREGANIHCGTQPESATELGSDCLIMSNAHVGHNCILGDHAKLFSNSGLAGHVETGDHVTFGGLLGVHQFVRVGRHVMAGGGSRVTQDVPPFFLSVHNTCTAINAVGMRRSGFSADEIADAKHAYKVLYRSGLLFRKAIDALAETVATDVGRQILAFVRAPSKRGIMGAPRSRNASSVNRPDFGACDGRLPQ